MREALGARANSEIEAVLIIAAADVRGNESA
jgi:hypothetical protein